MHPPRIRPLPGLAPLLRSLPSLQPSRKAAHVRLFTHNSQLLLVSSGAARPQLPFLSPVSRRRGGQWQISRLLTTEQRRYLREQIWLSGKYIAVSSAVLVCGLLIAFGVNNERLERRHPSPVEWTMMSRVNYRSARSKEEPEANGSGVVDWARVGNMYRELLKRLESADKDGQGLEEQVDGGILVAGVGKAGSNVEHRSYAWRRGYYETLRGAARAAEHLDGWVRDTTRNIAFPAAVMLGPSNPNPRPCPPGAASAPLEENCEPAFEHPETYYMKILTTKGFTTKERLDAALAYADWLEYKSLPSTAESMLRWGLDIAASPFPDAASILDPATGVIKPDATTISPNILLAATSLATHYAQTADTSSALPIFLSVLRARRSLPPSSTPTTLKESVNHSPSVFSLLWSMVVPPPYPAPPPSGDASATRSPASICDEAGVMTYIGEILYVSSSCNEGLAWTRDAVDLAELQYPATVVDGHGRARCQECLEVGLENWRKMVAKLARDEKQGGATESSWGLWRPRSKKGERGRWDSEMEVVEARQRRIGTDLLQEQMRSSVTGQAVMLG